MCFLLWPLLYISDYFSIHAFDIDEGRALFPLSFDYFFHILELIKGCFLSVSILHSEN